jgi:hypothetical protein
MNRVHQNHTRTAISGVHQFHTNTTPPTQKSGFYWAFSCVSDRTWREQSLSFQSVVSFVNWMSLVQSRHRAPVRCPPSAPIPLRDRTVGLIGPRFALSVVP